MEPLFELAAWVMLHPWPGAALFLLVFAVLMAIGAPAGNVLLLLAGFLFGTVTGTLLAVASLVLSAWGTHFLINTALGQWLQRRSIQGRWYAASTLLARGHWPLLLLVRMVPLAPCFLVNVALVLSGVPLRLYLLTTGFGVVPLSYLIGRIGAQFQQLDELSAVAFRDVLLAPGFYGPLAGIVLLTLLGWAILRRMGTPAARA